jgi:hypothetical protein
MTLCSLLVAGMVRGGMTWPALLVIGLTLSVCVQVVYAPESLLVMVAVLSGGAAVWVTKTIVDASAAHAMQPRGAPIDPTLHCKTCTKLPELRAARAAATRKDASEDGTAAEDSALAPVHSAEEYARAAQTRMFSDSAPVDCGTPERENDSDSARPPTPVQYHWAAYLPPTTSPARRPLPSMTAETAPDNETDLLSVD